MENLQPPDWVKDAIFYQIFPDRFARRAQPGKNTNLEPWDAPPTTHGFKGGDLQGITDRLDYLTDLGITAVYLNPVFQSAANHRYTTHDYFQVDPLLGGNEALRHLLDAAHQKGIRVILDGVFNHSGRGLFQFQHIVENGSASPYLDWFSISGFPLQAYSGRCKPNYAAWWGLRALPKFNTSNLAVREFLWSVAEHWTRFGIDGWRLDVPEDIEEPEFWPEFRHRVKSINPETYLVGEIWHPAPTWVSGDRFDGVTNYPWATACSRFFIKEDIPPHLIRGMGYAQGNRLEAPEFAHEIKNIMRQYRTENTQALLNLVGSHDTPRFLTLARGDESALRMAVLFQMTYPGAPCIYYGDEIGLEGERDPDCRRSFPWDISLWRNDLRDYVKACIALRHSYSCLRRGHYRALYAEDGVYAFARYWENETLIMAFNVTTTTRKPQISVDGLLNDGQSLRELWSGSVVPVASGSLLGVSLPPRSGMVWLPVGPGQY